MANKIEYGIEKVTVFELTEGSNGAMTYGSPVSLPGARSITMEPQGDEMALYADDSLYFSAYNSTGYKGTMGFAFYSDAIAKTLFGDTATADGGLAEITNAIPKSFGLAFECLGDAHHSRHVLYNVTFSRGSQERKTTEQGADFSDYSMDFTASPVELTDGKKIAKSRYDASAAGYANVFTALKLPTFSTD